MYTRKGFALWYEEAHNTDKGWSTKIKGAVPLGGCAVQPLQSTDPAHKMFPFKVTHPDFGSSALYVREGGAWGQRREREEDGDEGRGGGGGGGVGWGLGPAVERVERVVGSLLSGLFVGSLVRIDACVERVSSLTPDPDEYSTSARNTESGAAEV